MVIIQNLDQENSEHDQRIPNVESAFVPTEINC